MEETRHRDPIRDACAAACDGLRQIGDFSYAILPKDIAHACAELNKALLNQIRNLVDWEIRWTEERRAGGDRMRAEWKAKCETSTNATTGPAV